MQIAIHSKSFGKDVQALIEALFQMLVQHQAAVFVSKPLRDLLQTHQVHLSPLQTFVPDRDLVQLDLMISLGGDGTLLEAVNDVGATATPVLGMNTGRMGFLATVAQDEALAALASFLRGDYRIDKRTLLELEVQGHTMLQPGFALNEVAFLKRDTSSMIAVHACIDDTLKTTYWADGLLIATPTGSTGYSLSCGGPIVLPSACSLVVTPISPHNLAVRPLVVPDTAVLSFNIESRNQKFLVAVDGRSQATDTSTTLVVRKAPFCAHLVKIGDSNIFDVLRQKLHWGLDVRN